MAEPPSSRPTLLSLPPEIRFHIYSHTLVPIQEKRQDHRRYVFDLSILAVCKLTKEEAHRVLHRDHTFATIETPWPEARDWTKRHSDVPIVASGAPAKRWGPTKLLARITAAADPRPQQEYHPLIVLAEDLPSFCLHWFYEDLAFRVNDYPGLNSQLKLDLRIRNIENEKDALPLARQRSLLAPFGIIKDAQSVSFEGVNQEVKEDVLEEMKKPIKTPTECLEEAVRLKDLGNEAYTKARYQNALDLYIQAFRAIHIYINGRERECKVEAYFQGSLDRQVDGSDIGNIVYFKMRVRLVANVMEAYVRMKQWEEVKFWGLRSITLIRDIAGPMADMPNENIPGADLWGKIYYRTALAHEQLGDADEARAMYRTAHVWNPDYRPAAEAVERTRLRI